MSRAKGRGIKGETRGRPSGGVSRLGTGKLCPVAARRSVLSRNASRAQTGSNQSPRQEY